MNESWVERSAVEIDPDGDDEPEPQIAWIRFRRRQR